MKVLCPVHKCVWCDFFKYFFELMYAVNCHYLNHATLCCTLAEALDPEVRDAALINCDVDLTAALHCSTVY